MGIVVAIDAGTTGIRATAVAEDGRPIGQAYREFTQHFPQPGWVEHDAEEIWQTTLTVLAELRSAHPDPIAAIGITNQRETVVVWDARSGAALHRAIVWQDRRTTDRCDALHAAGHLPTIRRATGLVLDPYFSGTKLAWLLDEGGVAVGPDTRAGTIDSWLLWKLTGGAVHATEPSNASRTMLFDLATLDWSDDLCGLLDVPRSLLGEIRPTSGRFGVTADIGVLPAGIPVSGIAGDQQASLFGQACFEPGMTKNTYGTGSFVLMNIGHEPPAVVDGLLTTVAWVIGDQPTFALEGSIFSTGSAVQWLRDGLGIITSAAEVGPLAASVPDSGGVVVVPAFTGLGSPWWDPHARGTILGLTRGSGRAQLARAVVEAMAYQTRDVLDAMDAASGFRVRELRVDGGASAMDLLLQVQADQIGVPVTRPVTQETTVLGAAYLAGLAEGVWSSQDEIAANWAVDTRAEPAADSTAADLAHAQWRRAVAHTLTTQR